jgi:hypothetical protein
MPDFPSRADGDVPPAGDNALDELLTAGQPPQDAAAGLQPVAAVFAALRSGPADGELAGQARALAEFRSAVRGSHRAGQRRAPRPVPFGERLSSKLVIITAATAVAVSGTVAAAFVGALPGPLQRAAHDVIAAPSAGAAHGRAAPASFGARPLHTPTRSAAPPRRPVTGYLGWQHGRAGSAREHYRPKRQGHRKDRRDRWADRRQGTPGHRHDDAFPPRRGEIPMARYPGHRHNDRPASRRGDNPAARRPSHRHNDRPASRRGDNPMAYHKGSRLQSPLPRAAAFPIPPAGPDRPGTGGR